MEAHPAFFRDLAFVFLAAITGGLLAQWLRQPIIIGYVVAGILISPFTPGPSVTDVQTLELFAEIGVVLLMFSIGLEFSVKDLLREKWVALIGDPGEGVVPQLMEFDIDRGIPTRLLFEWQSLPPSTSVRIVATDASGRHLLLEAFVEGDPSFTLYRWSEGDAQPTKLAEEIAGADW